MLIDSPKSNFEILSRKLLILNGVAHQHGSILSQNNNMWKLDQGEDRTIHASFFHFNDIITGEDRFLEGNYKVNKHELSESLDDIMNMYHTYSLIQSFEAFKRFVKKDLSFRFIGDQSAFNSTKIEVKDGGQRAKCAFDLQAIRKGISFTYPSLCKMFGLYKTFSIEVDFGRKEKSALDILSTSYLAEEIRHSVVHGRKLEDKHAINLLTTLGFTEGVIINEQGDVKVSKNGSFLFNQFFARVAYYLYHAGRSL